MKKSLLLALIVLVTVQAAMRFTKAGTTNSYVKKSINTTSWKTVPGGTDFIKNILADRNQKKIKKTEETPLQQAVRGDSESVVPLFIDRGDDITVKDVFGQTLVHLTINNDDTKILKKLIKAGADVSKADSSGITPLHLYLNRILTSNLSSAIPQNAVALLIKAGADVTHIGIIGVSPYEMALWRKNNTLIFPLDTVKLFLGSVSKDEVTNLKTQLTQEQLANTSELLELSPVKEFIKQKIAIAKSILPIMSDLSGVKYDLEKNIVAALRK